jgi:hypothetical protein
VKRLAANPANRRRPGRPRKVQAAVQAAAQTEATT